MPLSEKNMGVITVHKKETPVCLIRSKSPVTIRSPHAVTCDGRPVPDLKGHPHTSGTERGSVADWPVCLSQDSIRKLQAQLEAEQQDLRAITQPILDTENIFVKQEVEQALGRGQTLGQRRRELLHKRWSEAVWTPIQRGVEQHVAQTPGRETHRLRSMLLHYLQHCNAKGFVFLDTYDPLEYNPFLFNSSCAYTTQVTTPVLKDPLLIQSCERMKEKRAVLRCQTGCHMYTRKQVEEILQHSLHPTPRCCSHIPTLEAPSLGTLPKREGSPWRPNR
ncbi:hypothetical protein ACEWY4_022434 [Coilia grayii]|uniref:Protein FAM228B n=1 Tax=Coilia grayii TaxID=363190 RepID=A0ABD1J615_9TELE